ncbi:SGNH/GDSL hydrolase family protein [Streptomyces sp. ATE26]|uniref:SGNH/GDSL hydrolase family protein n=1 Tax=unclassified Streptomyces TaxID=2593676 RepID=UPI00116BF350|nr:MULTISPECIES: SGNH/GDSL hydrolase family protein [unclassified Streptomyces]MDI1454443.1 SGNH/GDSL hydrolase family protein [Streptomyces sp. ATE26]GEK03547.1 SGNH hydrolase [Streptomyces sp. 1-11]
MRPVRFVALGDSLTEGVGDPAGGAWRGWAALLAAALTEDPGRTEFTNLAVSGALTRDVREYQTPAGLALNPDLASVVVGVNDTLRRTFDIGAVAARLDQVYAAFTGQGATLLTACLPDPGAMLGLPGALARPLARRQRAVNTVVHALSDRYGAVHLHAAQGAWLADRALWSADRLHPGERGHRQFAARFHALLAAAGLAAGAPPSAEPDLPSPTRAASLWWLATAGTGWVARRSTDLLPQLLLLAADEARHRARGTGDRLDLRASAAAARALAALPAARRSEDRRSGSGVQRRPAATKRTGVPGTACAAAGRSAARTTAITG